ncbi:MAG: HD domain-containing protein [Candidatus Gracilibacteria bacterium]|nr:HD domain-containing protein [Candidatus Gracilibacteria bacterium]
MKLTPLILKAITSATRLHNGATRKVDDTPFIVHPFSVAWIISEVTDDEEIIAAALLHDVLEDVKGYREEDMLRDFGPRITGIVKDVTEDKDPNKEYNEKATWKKRKMGYIDHLRTASPEAMILSCSDKISNLTSFLRDYRELGEEIWEYFNASREEKFWYESSLLAIFREVEDQRMAPLLGEYERLVKEVHIDSSLK